MRLTALNLWLFVMILFSTRILLQDRNPSDQKKLKVEWTFKAAMPGQLYAHASAIIGDKIYTIGGTTDEVTHSACIEGEIERREIPFIQNY